MSAAAEGQPLRVIKIMPNHGCDPLWGMAEHEIGPIDPVTLPISATRRGPLLRWAEHFDTRIDWNDPGGSWPWGVEEERRFWTEGEELAWALRDELGPGFQVVRFTEQGLFVAGPRALGGERPFDERGSHA